jgi:fibronectin-binding autotransporter adhesin
MPRFRAMLIYPVFAWRLPRGKILPALAAVLLAALAPARAQVITAVTSGDWSDGATWAGGLVPGAANTASLSAVTLTLGSSVTVGGLAGAADSLLTLASGVTLTTGGNNLSTTFAGVISGPGGLVATGTGVFVLSGANTYTGGTTFAGGIVGLAAANVLPPTGTLTVSGAILDLGNFFQTAGAVTLVSGAINTGTLSATSYLLQSGLISSVLAGPGALSKDTTGTVSLASANTYTGGTNINGGTLALRNADALGSTGTISFGGGTLQFGALNTTDYSGRFSTAAGQAFSVDTNGQNVTFASALTSAGGSLTKLGAGTLTLSGASTYTGVTTLSAGTLAYGVDNALSATTAVTVAGGATLDLAGFSGGIGALNGAGNVNLRGGSLQVNSTAITSSLQILGEGFSIGTVTLGGTLGTFVFGTGTTSSNSGGSTGAVTPSPPMSFSGVISGTGSLVISGPGLPVPSSANGILAGGINNGTAIQPVTLAGENTYTGGTVLGGGTLSLYGPGALGTTGTLSFGGGTLQFSAQNTTDYSGRFSQAPGQSYSFDTGGQVVTLASTLASAGGSLNKFGDGTLVLTGANTYTGGTVIWGGTLRVGSPDALRGAGALTIGASGSAFISLATSGLDLGGFTVTASTVTVGNATVANGTLAADAFVLSGGTVSANLAGAGSLTASVGTVVLSGANTYTGATIISSGTLAVSGGAAIGDVSDVRLRTNTRDDPFSGASGGVVITSSSPPPPPAVLLVNTSETIGSLSGGGSGGLLLVGGLVVLGPGAVLTVGANNASTEFAGAITAGDSASGLVKIGAGTLTLSGRHSYTGGTTVATGTLALADVGSISSSATISVAAGANLNVTGLSQGTLVLANNQTLVGSGTLTGKLAATTGLARVAPGGGGAVGTLTVGSLALSDHLALDFEFASLTSYDTINVTDLDGLSLLGGSFSFLTAGTTDPFTGLGTFDLITFTGSLLDPGNLLSTLTSSSVLNAAAGLAYTFGVTGDNTLAVTIDTRHHQWQAEHFGSTTALAAQPAADPDHDGVPNLLEYALGTDPQSAGSANRPALALAVSSADNLPHLTLTVTLAADAADVGVSAEVSGDLVNWQSGAPHTEIVSDTTAGAVRTLVLRDATPAGSGPPRFMRLRVALP